MLESQPDKPLSNKKIPKSKFLQKVNEISRWQIMRRNIDRQAHNSAGRTRSSAKMYGIRRESYDEASGADSTMMTMVSNYKGHERRDTIKQIIPDLNLKKLSKRTSHIRGRLHKAECSSSEHTNNTNLNVEITSFKQKAPLNTTRNEIPLLSGKVSQRQPYSHLNQTIEPDHHPKNEYIPSYSGTGVLTNFGDSIKDQKSSNRKRMNEER